MLLLQQVDALHDNSLCAPPIIACVNSFSVLLSVAAAAVLVAALWAAVVVGAVARSRPRIVLEMPIKQIFCELR